MKRTLIFFAILLPIVGFSQNKSVVYANDSLLFGGTAYHYDGYIQTPIYDSMGMPYDSVLLSSSSFNGSLYYNQFPYHAVISNVHLQSLSTQTYTPNTPRGFAQPMHSDTILNIGGVAIYIVMNADNSYNANNVFDIRTNVLDTICILDGMTLEPMYEKVLNDTLDNNNNYYNYNNNYNGMYEIIFDSAVSVQGDYYIAYKYCAKNIVLQQDTLDYFGHIMKNYFYRFPFVVYYDFNKYGKYQQCDQFANYDKQIRLLDYNYGWMNTSDFYNQFYSDTSIHYQLTGINNSYSTDLFPEDRGKFPHTTDLVVFGIKESAIIDSIDRPWLFAQDTTITDSTDTNSYISQINLERQISIQPNPTRGEVVISCPEPVREVAILNPMGQLLYREDCNQKRITLDLTSYPQGVYILHLQTPSGEVRKKIVRR